jgi:potassium-transporting ATPase potassium-binding subunit
MIRGFTRSRTDKLGNFWVDLTRGTIRLLLPLAVIGHHPDRRGRDPELR